jgi:hypothetical protein
MQVTKIEYIVNNISHGCKIVDNKLHLKLSGLTNPERTADLEIVNLTHFIDTLTKLKNKHNIS